MLPKPSHSLKHKHAGIVPDRVKIATDGKKRVARVSPKRKSVARSRKAPAVISNPKPVKQK